MNNTNGVHPVDQKLPLSQTITVGLQHVFIAIISAIPVPLLVSSAVGLSSEDTRYFISSIIFTSGICTLLATIGLIKKLSPQIPLMMGASFSVISVCITTLMKSATHAEGFQLIAGATLVSGLFCLLIAPLWSKLQPLFPQLVVATNTMILGVSLLPNAFHWLMDGSENGAVNTKSLFLGLFVFVLSIVLAKYSKGFIANISILITLIVGTIAALMFNMVDFAALADAPWVGITVPFKYGLPKFEAGTIISFLIVMILGMVEISGTVMGIHGIIGKEMNESQLTKTLQTTGINTIISGGFNSVQPVSFVQNMGLLDLSKVFSKYTAAAAGLMLVILSFFPKFSGFIGIIPKAVLGGVGFSTFGIIIASGATMLNGVNFEGNQNKLIVALSVGVAMIPATYPNFYANFPTIVQNIFGVGILGGSLTAILLNLFFNNKEIFGKKAE